MEECKSTMDIKIEKFLEHANLGYEVIDEGFDGKTMKLTGKAAEGAEHNELSVTSPHFLSGTMTKCATVSLEDTSERTPYDERGEYMSGSIWEDDPLYIQIMDMVRYRLVEPSALLSNVKGFLCSLGAPGVDWEFSTEDVANVGLLDIRRSMTRIQEFNWRRLVVHWRNAPEGKLWFVLYPKGKDRPMATLCDDKENEFVSVVTDLFAVLSEMEGMVYGNPDFNDMLPKVDMCISNIAKFDIDADGEKPTGTLPGHPVEGLGILDDSLLDMIADGMLYAIVPPHREEFGAITALYDLTNTATGWDSIRILSYEKQGKIEWTMNGEGQNGHDICRAYAFDEKSSKKLYRTMSLLAEAH